ncbi:MAG: hypothetical protein U0L05_08545 [Schaedlerella sp.]|nr:hypothetical protein [Schaedlerella sp.]
MRKIQEENLSELRNALEKLQKFVDYFSEEYRPYFYRMLDYMKDNIELYLKLGSKDLKKLEKILYRDWIAANNSWYGLSTFQMRKEICNENIEIYYIYGSLVQEIADYFETEV